MSKNIAAYTATGELYPEYVSINHEPNGDYSITVRGKSYHDDEKGYVVSGPVSEIRMNKDTLITILHDAHDKLFEVAP